MNSRELSFTIVFALLVSGSWSGGLASEEDPAHSLSTAVKAQLLQISDLLADRRSDDEVLQAWEYFVKKSRPTNDDACITFIFENAKVKAKRNAELAQKRIEQAEALKKIVAEEREMIRRVNQDMNQGKPLGKIPRKKFEIAVDSTGLFSIKQTGYISDKSELDNYTSHLDWAAKETETQRTSGVASYQRP